MQVRVGNDQAIEGYRDPGDPALKHRDLPGQRVTDIRFPEGVDVMEAFANTIGAMKYHMKDDAKPVWITSDSEDLKRLLLSHYELPPEAGTEPEGWGNAD